MFQAIATPVIHMSDDKEPLQSVRPNRHEDHQEPSFTRFVDRKSASIGFYVFILYFIRNI